MGDAGNGVRVVNIWMLGDDEGESMLDTKVVNIITEGSSLRVVDGIDDVVFGSVEVLGKKEYRKVWIKEVFLMFNILDELWGQSCRVAAGAGAGMAREPLGGDIDTIYRETDIEDNEAKRKTVCEDKDEKVIGRERIGEMGGGKDEEAEVCNDVEVFEIEGRIAVVGIVFTVELTKAKKLAYAMEEKEEGLDGEKCPKEIKIDEDDEVVAPVSGDEL